MKQIETECAYEVTKLLYQLEGIGWLTFFHITNEGKKKIQYAAKLKRMGLRAGVPDYWIGLNGGKSIFIELKTLKGAVSPSQKIIHAILKAFGFTVYLVRSDVPKDAANQVLKIIESERA